MKDLPRARHTHLKERLKEFAVAFDHWDYLNNTDLGAFAMCIDDKIPAVDHTNTNAVPIFSYFLQVM